MIKVFLSVFEAVGSRMNAIFTKSFWSHRLSFWFILNFSFYNIVVVVKSATKIFFVCPFSFLFKSRFIAHYTESSCANVKWAKAHKFVETIPSKFSQIMFFTFAFFVSLELLDYHERLDRKKNFCCGLLYPEYNS